MKWSDPAPHCPQVWLGPALLGLAVRIAAYPGRSVDGRTSLFRVVMVLLYAHLTETWWHGILDTLAMAAGTGLSVSAIAVVTVVCRERLLRLLWRGQASDTASLIFWQRALALIGGLLLMGLGVVLWSGARVAKQIHPLFPG